MEPRHQEGIELHAEREEDPDERLLGILFRLFSTALLYPPGHQSYETQAMDFLTGIGRSPTYVVYVAKEAFLVQSRAIDLVGAELKRLHERLEPLGIVCIEIDVGASTADLHAFVVLIAENKRQVDQAHAMQHLSFDSLPPTIRVHERKFGSRTGGVAIETVQLVERTIEGMHDLYQNEETAREGDRVLRRLLSGVVERIDLNAYKTGDQPGAPKRSADVVLEACARALRSEMTRLLATEAGLANPGKLFEAAEAAVALADDTRGIGAMLDVVQQSPNGPEHPGTTFAHGVAEDDPRYELPLEELGRQLAELVTLGEPLPKHHVFGRSEVISILLQILFDYPSPGVMNGIGACFASVFSEPLSEREQKKLLDGLLGLFETGDEALVDRSFPILANALAGTNNVSPCDLLVEISRRSALPGLKEVIWPHAVDEILLGGRPTKQKESRLKAIVSNASSESGIERVQKLRAIYHGRFAESVFQPPRPELYPLFGHLLETSESRALTRELRRGFQKYPPGWCGAEALQAVGTPTPARRALLIQILREGAVEKASPKLQAMAADLILSSLSELPPERRHEVWVETGIEALGELPERKGTRPVLERIRVERRHFRKVWPVHTRRAAAASLKRLEKTGAKRKPKKKR